MKFLTLKNLTIANFKMFVRDRMALFWTLFFPILIIGIFGALDFAGPGTSEIGLVYDEGTEEVAQNLKKQFENFGDYEFYSGSLEEELELMENDDRIMVVEFETPESPDGKIDIKTYLSPSEESQSLGNIITNTIEKNLTQETLAQQQISLPFEIETETVNVNDLRYIDFIVPGVIAMSVMQGALFGVIGTIVVHREKGVLRRLFATPLNQSTYLISNIITRMVVSLVQIAILLALSYVIFDIRIVGNIGLVFGLSALGSLVFLAMGFLVSGFAKTEESARAMIMPIQMLFMFTGGVYFQRDVLPKWLFDATSISPLTYLSDALKEIMTQGYDLGDRSIQIASGALLVWLVGLVIVAVKTFRWDSK